MKDEVMKGVGSNVTTLGIVSFLTDISSEMIFPVLPIFITSILGAGKEALGIIEGLADSIASLVEIFSGYFSDKTGKRKQLVIAGYGLSSVVKVGIALSTAWWHVLIMRSLERIGKGIRTSPRDAIIASSSAPDARGKAFGFHRMMDTIGAIIGPVIAYFIFAWFGTAEPGYRTLFLAAIIPAFLAVLVLILFVKEPEKSKQPEKRPSFWQSLKELTPEYKTFLKISLVFSLSYFSFAFFIVRATDLGIAPESVVVLYILYNIVYAASSIPAGALSDKIGRRAVIAAS
ncbi:MAG: MFS transporter, partial [Candidatus Micrarchaeia archaeon]